MNDALVERACAAFAACVGAPPAFAVQAPGRVNLIGEHTDYNGGFVLPCAIDFRTVIVAAMRSDRRVRVIAADYDNAVDEYDLDATIEQRKDAQWPNYVRGVVVELMKRQLPVQGVDMAIAGDVPQGAGLSSSASLEIAVAQVFRRLAGFESLTPIDVALIGQRAENDFVGCQCGNMDQIISACGAAGHALLIDCRSLETRAVPIPRGAAIMIFNSHIVRGLVTSEYNARRLQCEAAALQLGVPQLRDLDMPSLERGAGALDPVVRRRARHVVSEDARVLAAATALEQGDLVQMGQLMEASHVSMRDDFEITVPPIDRLVEIVKGVIGTAGGVRMTGGGFGGCVVALVPDEFVGPVRAAVDAQYRSPGGDKASIYVCSATEGAGVIDLPRDCGGTG